MDTDLSLLDAARKLDQKALVAIFDRYAVDVYNYALRLRSDPLKADNTVGDVFSKFLEQLAAGKEPKMNLRSHLYKITYHLTVDGSRFSKREAALELANFELNSGDERYSMSSNLENKILMEMLILAIKKHLTADQRHVIILHFVEGFSLPETAEIVGKEVSTVKAIQSRAIAKLCKVMNHTVSA
jgi:RNA polymerase sigma-70 factor (ECF subfamily)